MACILSNNNSADMPAGHGLGLRDGGVARVIGYVAYPYAHENREIQAERVVLIFNRASDASVHIPTRILFGNTVREVLVQHSTLLDRLNGEDKMRLIRRLGEACEQAPTVQVLTLPVSFFGAWVGVHPSVTCYFTNLTSF